MPKSMEGVMDEFKHGDLHSGSSSGPRVRNPKQAIAIGLSEQRQMGKKVPPNPHHEEAHHHLMHAHDHLAEALGHMGHSDGY
jgi:uncharacterized protein DUF6496